MAKLLTLAELAKFLDVDLTTVQRRKRNGTLGIPVYDISVSGVPKPRVKMEDVEAYLHARQVS